MIFLIGLFLFVMGGVWALLSPNDAEVTTKDSVFGLCFFIGTFLMLGSLSALAIRYLP